MNFTREPIIETVITPREGCKLVLRNSKGGETEEHIVEAVEVVSFGRSFFYRSVESSKEFLLPVSDYEIVESKEARIALKNVQSDRQIKIGGGREAQLRPQQQRRPEQTREMRNEPRNEEPSSEAASQSMQPQDRKRDRRRRGRRGRGGDRMHDMQPSQHSELRESLPPEFTSVPTAPSEEPVLSEAPVQPEEMPKAPSFISKLFPPPPTLIKETLSRYKTVEETETFPENEERKLSLEETIFDHPITDEKDEDIHFEDR